MGKQYKWISSIIFKERGGIYLNFALFFLKITSFNSSEIFKQKKERERKWTMT